MTADIKLLPLYAELQGHPKLEIIKHYARANVAHATEALRAEVEQLMDMARMQAARADAAEREARHHSTRAERLAEALRPLANLDLRPDGFDKRPDDQTIYARDQTAITVGHVRRAQAALRDHDQEGKNG